MIRMAKVRLSMETADGRQYTTQVALPEDMGFPTEGDRERRAKITQAIDMLKADVSAGSPVMYSQWYIGLIVRLLEEARDVCS